MQDIFRGMSTTKTSVDGLYQQGRDYCAKYKLSIAHLVIYCEIMPSTGLQKLTGEFKVSTKFSKCDFCDLEHVNGLDILLRRISKHTYFISCINPFQVVPELFTLQCQWTLHLLFSYTIAISKQKNFPCMRLHIRNTEETFPNMNYRH